jgi:hypothetical protein
MNKAMALAGAVFTAAQAEAGRIAYENTCGKRHTPTLPGRIAAARLTIRSVPAIHWIARFCPASCRSGFPQPPGIENRGATDRAF